MSITKIQKQLEAPPNHPGHVDLFYVVRGRGLYGRCVGLEALRLYLDVRWPQVSKMVFLKTNPNST